MSSHLTTTILCPADAMRKKSLSVNVIIADDLSNNTQRI